MVENPEEKNELENSEKTTDESVVSSTAETAAAEPAEKKVKDADDTSPESLEGVLPQEEIIDEGPHDDFDWSISNKNVLQYSEDEITEFSKKYERKLSILEEYEVINARVSAISRTDIFLDVGYKADGLLPLSEFRDLPDLQVGDEVAVYVESREDQRGQLLLSRRKAKLLKAWDAIKDSYVNGTIINGQVISKTKGGLIVDTYGLETFLPGSQIDIKPIIDYDSYVGKKMEFKVVKINEQIKNAVVSHKAIIESGLAEQREAIISGMEKGQVLEGVVKNITDFGAFMDLGGVDGLLYITDISWGRINHPSEVLELDQNLNVVVLDFDEEKKRISLGLKQLQPHPWEVLGEDIQIESLVKGKIVNIEDYGAFLEISPGVEGLIHVSEVSWSNQPVNAREFFKLDQDFEAKVVTIDREERKMSLSLKQLMTDPWTEIESKFSVGSKHSGEVKNLTPYGVFVELEEGIGGMVHISDLSWTKRFSHPSEFTKVGETIEISILEIDKENRKLSLGHKQLEENPWDTFENVFPVGSYHEATILKKEERGAIVQLPYGLEAYAPIKHIKKEDGQFANPDETLTVKVIEFNRDDKRILVSHLRYLEDIKKEATDTVRTEKQQERKSTKSGMSNQRSKMEKTTLGELDVFTQLKAQMKENAPTPPPLVKATPVVEEVKEEAPVVEEAKVETPAVEEVKEEAPVVEEAKVEAPVVEEAKEEAPVVEEVKEEAPAVDAKPDDLKKIEGIGPKISEVLANNGISSFKILSETDPEAIKVLLEAAGPRYKMHDPGTWPKQAGLAAAGEWDALKKLQDELDGGKA